MKVGSPAARQARASATPLCRSECPLAGKHIMQGMELLAKDEASPERSRHPIEILARAYGIRGRLLAAMRIIA